MAIKKKNNLTWYLIGTAVVLVIVIVVGKKAGFIGAKVVTKVATEKVALRTITETVSASGKIQPESEVKISSDVSGEIVALYVKEGDKVQQGDLLVKIKPDVYLSLVDRAKAALNTAKANLSNAQSRLVQVESQYKRTQASFERSKKLYADKVIAEAEYETALSSFEVAKAEVQANKESVSGAKFNVASGEASLKEAQDNLNRTTIKAPVDGTIYGLKVETGERVVGTSQMAGTEMMRIANLGLMEVSVDVNENDIARLNLKDTALIEVDAYLDKKFKGLVTEIANSANLLGTSVDQVTNFTVKIRILPESYAELVKPGVASPFRPGLSATVEIETEKRVNVIAVPIQAVTTRSDSSIAKAKEAKETKEEVKTTAPAKANLPAVQKEYVFVYDKGVAKLVEVTTGIQDDVYIEVKMGAKVDDELIVAPYLAVSKKLKDADKVEKVEKEKLFSADKE